jgi:tetratricopeptide (TPR) repeat protein
LLTQLVDIRHPENGFTWLMLVAIVVIALALWRTQFGAAVIQAAALYLAVEHARYIGLFCVTTVIAGGTLLGEAFSTGPPEPGPQFRPKPQPLIRVPVVLALVFICAICAITVLHAADFISNRTHVVFRTESRFGAGEASWFPERAASFIRRERLPGNIFEEYGLGGFAAWRLGPEHADFIDGRFDHLAPAVLVEEQKLLSQAPGSPAWQAAADKWGINVLLILEAEPRAVDREDAMAFCQSANWSPIYMDEISLVLVRNIPSNRPWIDRLQIDCRIQRLVPPPSASRKDLYDYFANAGGMLYALQRDHESEAALRGALVLYPEDPNARLVLAQLYQRHQMLDKAEAEYRASLALSESDQPWYELGQIYVQQRRLPEAGQAFARAAHLSVNPLIPYMALAQVELWQKHPEAALEAFSGAERSSPYRSGAESLAPDLYAEIADGRSDAQFMLSHLSQAIEFQKEAVRLTPSVANRWNKLADLYDSAGQSDLSQQAREKARELDHNAGPR